MHECLRLCCPYLKRGGYCGARRIMAGPDKDRWTPLDQLDACPIDWSVKKKEVGSDGET